uniref:Uncharacterized protein n=1 Tax=Cacopsylla melanoneura TaxID=428564 RepID=A0A8D8YHV8_9HEMI
MLANNNNNNKSLISRISTQTEAGSVCFGLTNKASTMASKLLRSSTSKPLLSRQRFSPQTAAFVLISNQTSSTSNIPNTTEVIVIAKERLSNFRHRQKGA